MRTSGASSRSKGRSHEYGPRGVGDTVIGRGRGMGTEWSRGGILTVEARAPPRAKDKAPSYLGRWEGLPATGLLGGGGISAAGVN